MSDDIVTLPNTGQPIGHVMEGADGDRLLVGFDGRILNGVDVYHQPLAEWELQQYPQYAYEVDPVEERQAVFERDLALAEERFAPIRDYYEPEPEYEEEPQYEEPEYEEEPDAEVVDAVRQIEREVERRGFDLTRAELTELGDRVREDIEAGRPVDVRGHVSDMTDEGKATPNLDNRQDRIDWQVERLQDGERAERGQELGEPDPPANEEPNLDDRQQRVDWMTDRMAGRA